MKTRQIAWIALASVGLTVLGGCKSVSQRDYDAAIDENTQLRERIAGLQENVRQANEGSMAFEDQNNQLRADNQRLSNDLNQARSQIADLNSRPQTGFEGVNGIDVGFRSGGAIVVRVPGDVLFSSGSDALRKDAKATLDQIARVIRSEYPDNTVRVEGYTDTDKLVKTKKKWGTNENLSANRALAVETYLVGKGIDNDRIYSAAFGPSHPKASKKESRRVEIVILGE